MWLRRRDDDHDDTNPGVFVWTVFGLVVWLTAAAIYLILANL